MDKSPTLKNQAKALFTGNVLATILQLVIPMLLVRIIDKHDFGVFRQFTLITLPAITMLGWGYRTSLYYFYPVADEEGRAKIIQQTQFLFLINAILAGLLVLFFGDKIFDFFEIETTLTLKVYLFIYIAFELLASILDNIFTLEKNLKLNRSYFPIEKLMRLIIFVVAVLAVPGYYGPILALTIYGAFRFFYLLQHIWPYFKKIHKIDAKLLKDQLIYSLPFGVAIILTVLSSTFDKFYINKFVTTEQFAVYSQSFVSIPILSHFFKSIHDVVVPQISVYLSKNQLEPATKLWQKTVDKTSNLTIPAVFIFWIMANELITVLYTENYIEAAKYYRVFVLIFFVTMFSHNIILRGSGRTNIILISSIITTILTVILGLMIIPVYGLYGAVITSLLGNIMPMIINLNYERKIMGLRISNWVNWKNIGINFLICFAVGIPIFLFKDNIPNLFVRGIGGGIVFVVAVAFLQMKFGIFMFQDFADKILKSIKR